MRIYFFVFSSFFRTTNPSKAIATLLPSHRIQLHLKSDDGASTTGYLAFELVLEFLSVANVDAIVNGTFSMHSHHYYIRLYPRACSRRSRIANRSLHWLTFLFSMDVSETVLSLARSSSITSFLIRVLHAISNFCSDAV